MGSPTTAAWPGDPADVDPQVPPPTPVKPKTWVGGNLGWKDSGNPAASGSWVPLFSASQTQRLGWDMDYSSLLRNWSNLDINSYLASQTGPQSERYCWTCLGSWSFSVSREHSATAIEKPKTLSGKTAMEKYFVKEIYPVYSQDHWQTPNVA